MAKQVIRFPRISGQESFELLKAFMFQAFQSMAVKAIVRLSTREASWDNTQALHLAKPSSTAKHVHQIK